MKKQALASFLLLIMLLTGVAYPLRANAVLGVIDIGIDLVKIGEWITDILIKTVIETFKKRLLDMITDRIVKYIQGEGDPKFIQNFEGVIGDAFQAAVGDTVLELDLANLCYQPSRFKLRVELMQTQFSQRVSCTLDSVVKNIGAFKNDFKTGGWIAYQESLKLQNTLSGISLLTQDELLRRTNSKTEVARYEATVGAGFLGQKRCNQWRVVNKHTDVAGNEWAVGMTASGPGVYDSTPDGIPYTGKTDRPIGSNWGCTQPETVTPGKVASEAVTQALFADITYLQNSEGLQQILSAAINASINRLTKETVQGLAYVTTERNYTQQKNCDDLEGGVKVACKAVEPILKIRESLQKFFSKKLSRHIATDAKEQIEEGGATIRDTLTLNDDLVGKLGELKTCLEGKGETIAVGENRFSVIDTKLASAFGQYTEAVVVLDKKIPPKVPGKLAGLFGTGLSILNIGSLGISGNFEIEVENDSVTGTLDENVEFRIQIASSTLDFESFFGSVADLQGLELDATNVSSTIAEAEKRGLFIGVSSLDMSKLELLVQKAVEKVLIGTVSVGSSMKGVELTFNSLNRKMNDSAKWYTRGRNFTRRTTLKEWSEESIEPPLGITAVFQEEIGLLFRKAKTALDQCEESE